MSIRPISEKAAEILFNRCILQSFELGAIQLLAPTSREEFRRGYDSGVIGPKQMQELYLQFKAPMYSPSRNRYTVQITPHQHRTLQSLYPPNVAYYVAPLFRTLEEFAAAQLSITGTVAIFLRYYLCIEVHTLPGDAEFLNYQHPVNHQTSPQAAFKIPSDGPVRIASHPIPSHGWCRGSTLLRDFKSGAIGASVRAVEDRIREHPLAGLGDSLTSQERGRTTKSDCGVILRTPVP